MTEAPDFEIALDVSEIEWDEVSKDDAFALRTTSGIVMAGTIVGVELPKQLDPNDRFLELDENVEWYVDEGVLKEREPHDYDSTTGLSISEYGTAQLLIPSPVYNATELLYWAVDRGGKVSAFESGAVVDPERFIQDVEKGNDGDTCDL